MSTLNCTKCDGAGEKHSDYANFNPATKQFSGGMKKCIYCDGRGNFPALDSNAAQAIVNAVYTSKGKIKRFRKSMTSPVGRNPEANRVYYVWRLARFHGGADVTIPMTAMMLIEGDPVAKDLDALADMVARAAFGTSNAAAHRWGNALGYNVPETPGLPASAFSGGPVHDGNDPDTTLMLELEENNHE